MEENSFVSYAKPKGGKEDMRMEHFNDPTEGTVNKDFIDDADMAFIFSNKVPSQVERLNKSNFQTVQPRSPVTKIMPRNQQTAMDRKQ